MRSNIGIAAMCAALAACGTPPSKKPAAPVAAAAVSPAANIAPAPTSPPSPVPPIDPTKRGIGPLSTRQKPPETPWSERQVRMRANEKQTVGKAEMRADLAELERVMDLWFAPRTVEHRIGMDARRQHVKLLLGLAPYAVDSTTRGIAYIGERIGYCTRPPGETWPCDPYFHEPPARDPARPVYEITVDRGGVARFVVRDLSNASDPAWAKLANDVGTLAAAKGIVLDLRGAAGNDPRSLVPWLESVTGRQPLAPLREIRRQPALTPYVDAYRARFVDQPRDAAIWQSFVGSSSPQARTIAVAKRPIAVIVDTHCQSACELVARVLRTSGNAIVVGGVGRSGRLARDEPALQVLAHSRIEIYFYATEYLLDAAIEQATGPTEAWPERQNDPRDTDVLAYAVRDVTARIANPRWPGRCDALPAAPDRDALPATARAKVNGNSKLGHCRSPGTIGITLHSPAPSTALRRFLATCPIESPTPSLSSWGINQHALHVKPRFALLSRLAQSELVESIYIDCQQPPQLDRGR